jgi:hypothetical protein
MIEATSVRRSAAFAVLLLCATMTTTGNLASAQILDARDNYPVLSPITNRWGEAETTKVEAEHFEIFRGHEGAAYSHHAQITSLDGRLYASWSIAPVHEDEPGQRMVLATSDDRGKTWSEPRTLVGPLPGEHDQAIVTAMGIRVHEGWMMAYYGYYDYTERGLASYRERGGINKRDPSWDFHQGTYTGIMVSDDAGDTWRGPVGIIKDFMPNLAPQKLANGRLIIPGNFSFPYTDDPYGIVGWKRAAVPRVPENYVDDPEGLWTAKAHRGDALAMAEASFFETDDGVIHMLLRTQAYSLTVTESRDRGVTWSEPKITAYTDCKCRFHFGRLPDGRYFGLSCPRPASRRTPMVLAVSEDGVAFDRHFVLGDDPAGEPRMKGFAKGGRYGYPSYHIADGWMYVIYSINKEDIGMCRFPLSALSR